MFYTCTNSFCRGHVCMAIFPDKLVFDHLITAEGLFVVSDWRMGHPTGNQQRDKILVRVNTNSLSSVGQKNDSPLSQHWDVCKDL